MACVGSSLSASSEKALGGPPSEASSVSGRRKPGHYSSPREQVQSPNEPDEESWLGWLSPRPSVALPEEQLAIEPDAPSRDIEEGAQPDEEVGGSVQKEPSVVEGLLNLFSGGDSSPDGKGSAVEPEEHPSSAEVEPDEHPSHAEVPQFQGLLLNEVKVTHLDDQRSTPPSTPPVEESEGLPNTIEETPFDWRGESKHVLADSEDDVLEPEVHPPIASPVIKAEESVVPQQLPGSLSTNTPPIASPVITGVEESMSTKWSVLSEPLLGTSTVSPGPQASSPIAKILVLGLLLLALCCGGIAAMSAESKRVAAAAAAEAAEKRHTENEQQIGVIVVLICFLMVGVFAVRRR